MLMGATNTQSPFRLHSLEPCVRANSSSNGGDGGLTAPLDDQRATPRHTAAPVGVGFPRKGSYVPATGALTSNIIEVDSENSDRSPKMTVD